MKKLFAAILFCFLLCAPAFAAETRYILFERGGYVCVFEEGDLENPAIKTDIYADLLPKDDQRRLREGIEVSSRGALLEILEDFGS